jgi:hypothetical protein
VTLLYRWNSSNPCSLAFFAFWTFARGGLIIAYALGELIMRFSQKLGPRARRIAATNRDGQIVESVVEIARSADRTIVERQITRAGGRIRSHARSSPFLRVDVDVAHLNALALCDDVIYVEADELRQYAAS